MPRKTGEWDEYNTGTLARLHDERGRWYGLLQRAYEICVMFELDRPTPALVYDPNMRANPETIASLFFWNTMSRRTPLHPRNEDGTFTIDGPEEDMRTAFATIVGLEGGRGGAYTIHELRLALNVSGDRILKARSDWQSFGLDFQCMMRGLSGDLGRKAMRHLVLGQPEGSGRKA